MTKVLIIAIYLSQALIGGVHATTSDGIRLADNNPFSGATSLSVTLAKETFTTPKAPVPYWEFWDCQWRQTAQQCVAIYSLLEDTTRR